MALTPDQIEIIKTVVEVLVSPIIDQGYEWIISKFKKSGGNLKFVSTIPELTDSIQTHLQEVCTWSLETSFSLNKTSKDTNQIFVDLNYYLTPKRTHYEKEDPTNIELSKIFIIQDKNLIVLGYPGAGKSTSMKFICQKLLFEENFFKGQFTFPVVIRLRDLNNANEEKSLFFKLANTLGLNFYSPKEQESDKSFQTFKYNLIKDVIIKYIDTLNCILILDGFDELSSESMRTEIIAEVRSFTLGLVNSRVIMTSRTGEFRYYIENTNIYEIAPLDDEQIVVFTRKWLADDRKSKELVHQIERSPFYDTAVRPLTLAHLCAIYERSGKIPDKPKTVYELIINLMLKEWNEQWSVRRLSKYSQFEPERKIEFLSQLSFLLTVKYNTTRFSTTTLRECYGSIRRNFRLPEEEINDVIDEVESHTGLLLQSGYQTYEFAHKSLQEFLTAKYINSVPIPHQSNVLEKLANELAIATSLSINPTHYLHHLAFMIVPHATLSPSFFSTFLNRMALEKPDFTISPIVCISLLYVVEDFHKKTYLEKTTKDTGNLINRFSKLKDQIKPLFDLPNVVESSKHVFKYLRFKEQISKYNISDFALYFRTKQLVDDFMEYHIPNKLFIPKWLDEHLHEISK